MKGNELASFSIYMIGADQSERGWRLYEKVLRSFLCLYWSTNIQIIKVLGSPLGSSYISTRHQQIEPHRDERNSFFLLEFIMPMRYLVIRQHHFQISMTKASSIVALNVSTYFSIMLSKSSRDLTLIRVLKKNTHPTDCFFQNRYRVEFDHRKVGYQRKLTYFNSHFEFLRK